jgi:hypothetical protein
MTAGFQHQEFYLLPVTPIKRINKATHGKYKRQISYLLFSMSSFADILYLFDGVGWKIKFRVFI